jgi:hypothetical protein
MKHYIAALTKSERTQPEVITHKRKAYNQIVKRAFAGRHQRLINIFNKQTIPAC